MKQLFKRLLGGWGVVAGIALAVATGLAIYQLPFGTGAIHFSYDLLFTLRPPIPTTEAVMVYMDDDSHERLKQRYDAPWDRLLHAQLVNRLTAAGAKAIVFDVVFSDPHPNPEVDQEFGGSILSAGNVVLAADTVPAGYGLDLVQMKQVTLPTEALRDAAGQIGSAEVKPSPDLVVRSHYHGSPDDLLTSMSWATATLLEAPVASAEEDRFDDRWINYYGPPGAIPGVSYHRALNTNDTSNGDFKDRVVFIGSRLFTKFAGDRKDEFRSPYAFLDPEHPFVPGVEVQATQFLNLLRGDWLTRWSVPSERWGIIAWGVLFGAGLVLLRPWFAVGVTAAAVAGVGVTSYIGFVHGRVWFPWVIPVVQAGVALGWAVVFNSIKLFVQKRLLEQSLALHLSPSRVKQLIRRPELLRPGAEKWELSIMFSDIADFTKMSEGMDSDDLARMMNGYFESAISSVHDSDGTVVKLIGDAIFAIWNAPIEQADHQVRACRTALLLRDQPVKFTTPRKEVELFTRIGLHAGVANVGNFGSATRFDYTALGENINLASRMEGMNKHLGTQVLITGEIAEAARQHFVLRPLGAFQLKGFEKPVEVFELVDFPEHAEKSKEWREAFAQALALYQDQDLTTAELVFNQVLNLKPDDGPSKFYLKRIKELESDLMSMKLDGGHTKMTRMTDK